MKSIWLASVCALAIPAAGFAQAPASPATSPDAATAASSTAGADEDDLARGEIVITATRRSQVLSDVPIAVSAVSAEQLRNSGGSDIRQLNQLAPSLLVSSATNDSSAVARIRGIGTVGENPGLESSVAVFIDGVYRSRTGVGLTELGEIERIEVLRGPQGTLFGRNASAGLINILTAKPSFEFGGIGEASYGNYDAIRIQGGLTGPILGDSVAFRIDGVYNKRDGFLPDVISGRDTANRDRFLIRGQLLIKPSDDLSIRLIGDYSEKDEECCGAAFIAPTRNLTRAADGSVVASPNTIQQILTQLGAVYPLPANANDKYTRQASITPGRGYFQATKDYGFSGEINYRMGDVSLTSITAYREYKNKSAQDSDFNNLDILYRDDQDRKFQTFTQELRLQGSLFNDRLDFLVGGFYSDEKLTVDDNIKYGADYERFANCILADSFARNTGQPGLVNTADSSCFNRPVAGAVANAIGGATGAQIRALAGLAPLSAAGFNPLGGFRNVAAAIGFPSTGAFLNGTGVVQNEFKQQSRNYAIFTHNVISIIPDKLLLTLGARYTNERKTLESNFNANNTFCAALRATPLAGLANLPCVINANAGPGFTSGQPGTLRKESEFTGTVVLSFKPVDELLTYASYSRGYKAGGYNLDTSALDAPNAALAALPLNTAGNGRVEAADLQFEPEIVDAYELGAKLDLRDFKLNAALFYQSFNNFQLNTFNGVNFEVANIAACKDDLGGRDTDLIAGNSACAADRKRAGVVSKGVELEAFFFPARDVTFTAGVTYTDTSYRKNLTGLNGVSLAPTLFQLPGSRLSNSSAYVATTSIAFTPEISETLSALFYLDFRYQSDLNTGSDLDIEKAQDGFGVVNGRIGLYGKDRIWGIELWGQNLLDQKYQQIAADAPLQGGGTFAQTQRFGGAAANGLYITFPAEPRTYGITLRTRF